MTHPTKSSATTQLDQSKMPFLESLLKEKHRWQTSFHMPGHKGTMPPHPMLLEYLGGNIHPADLVEINGIIDYLHSPKGALLEAQQLAARAYGAEVTFFLINGSTVGNIASVMSSSRDGDKVIMPRASHRSVYGGVVQSGATPVYVPPIYQPEVGFPLATDTKIVEKLLAENPGVTAIHITSPNYYGYMSDTAAIATMAHARNAAMLVDEAHGSHLHFHEGLPESATQLGVDMIIQSTHKTQSALTQASMLHCNDRGFINVARVGQVLALLQSSSPSSPLLASLDAARMLMATQGRDLLDKPLQLANAARESIRQIPGLWCYGDDLIGSYGIYTYDPMKLVIRVSDMGYSGFVFYDKLRYEHGIDGEFADLKHVICSVTIGDTEASINKLLTALKNIAAEKPAEKANIPQVSLPTELPKMALPPREAYFATSKVVPLAQSVGEICAENIIPYPPGIPLIVPGEIIEKPYLDYLAFIRSQGGGVVGLEDKTLETVRVVTK